MHINYSTVPQRKKAEPTTAHTCGLQDHPHPTQLPTMCYTACRAAHFVSSANSSIVSPKPPGPLIYDAATRAPYKELKLPVSQPVREWELILQIMPPTRAMFCIMQLVDYITQPSISLKRLPCTYCTHNSPHTIPNPSHSDICVCHACTHIHHAIFLLIHIYFILLCLIIDERISSS